MTAPQKKIRRARPRRHLFSGFFALCLSLMMPVPETGGIAIADDGQQFSSFINYQLKPAHFQSSFHDIIELIASGSEVPTKKTVLRRALKLLAAREKSESRGRRDIIYFLEGYTHEKLGQRKQALEAYGRAVKEKSQSPLYIFRHALMLKEENRCQEAVHEFEEIAWTVRQASFEPLYLAGECMEKLGRAEDAKRLFQEAAKRNPKYGPVLKKLLVQLKEDLRKEFDPKKRADIEARIKSSLDVIVSQNPKDREMALEYAELLLQAPNAVLMSANLSRAGGLAQPFVTQSHYKDERAVAALFRAQRRLGKSNDAAETLRKGLEKNPASPSLLAANRELAVERQLQEPSTSDR